MPRGRRQRTVSCRAPCPDSGRGSIPYWYQVRWPRRSGSGGSQSRPRSREDDGVGRSRRIVRPVASEADPVWMITPFRVRVAAAVNGGPHRPPPGSRRGRPPRRSDVLAAFDAHRPQPSPRTDRNQCGRSPRSTTSRRGHVALTTRTARRADVREPAAGRVAGRLSDGRVSHSAGCRTGFATDQRERGRRSVPMQRGDSAACCSRNGTGLGPT
jgi:hypothetical protein